MILQTNPAPQSARPLTHHDLLQLKQAMATALREGSVTKLGLEEVHRTKTWTPVFLVPKKDSAVPRMITDLRGLNRVVATQPFHPDGWKEVLLLLQDPTALWGATLDMESWFHNLAVRPEGRR